MVFFLMGITIRRTEPSKLDLTSLVLMHMEHRYRITRSRRRRLDLLIVVPGLLFVAGFVGVVFELGPPNFNWVFILVVGEVVAVRCLVLRGQRLTLSSEGVVLTMGFNRADFPWNAVGPVTTLDLGRMTPSVEGLPLRAPAGVFLGRLENSLVRRKRGIPLAWFDPEWRTGPIGEDLRRWAPHVLEGVA